MSAPGEVLTRTYRGIIRVDETSISMDAGGVNVKLEGEREKFIPLNGLFTSVTGYQEGDTIRNAAPVMQPEAAAAASSGAELFAPVIATIKANQATLMANPAVLGVTPGFRTQNGEQTEEPAINVVTKPGESVESIPDSMAGIPVQTREASPLEIIQGVVPLSAWEGIQLEAGPPQIGYTPPEPPLALVESQVRNITCHVGPDAGWSSLRPFLEGTTRSLTVAMYEFYADHIINIMTSLGEETDASLNMILQVSSNDSGIEETLRESWGDRLSFTRASVKGPQRIFNNSYHTKVAVRDSNAFWLSSGNWNPTSQPIIGPGSEQVLYSKGNREWHVIIEDEPLARLYEGFIEHDIAQAREVGVPEAVPAMPDLLIPESMFEPEAAVVQDHPFEPVTFATSEPVTVMPLMSPDNYAAGVLELIRNAERSLYLQFSYIRQPSAAIFDEIITAISEKMHEGLDVKVLVGRNQIQDHSNVLTGARGWKRSMFRRQTSKMHNKGILIDGKIAAVGSNNWSSDGTQYNRDTTLVFFSRPITKYFTEVFMFDWDNLSRPIGSSQEVMPVIAPDSGPTPLGMIRIPWQAWFDE